jgi:hypothetical protein
LSDRELQNAHVMACINFLRRHYLYRYGSLVYIVENAPGSRASELASQLRNVENAISMREFGARNERRCGVPKTREITHLMVLDMRTLLVTDAISFAHDMGTYPPDITRLGRDAAVAAIQYKICDQLLAFELDEHGKWSGKKGPTGLDDAAVAVLMIRWARKFFSDPLYADFIAAARQRHANCVSGWMRSQQRSY